MLDANWAFIPGDDATGDETWCEDCTQTIPPTESVFSHRDHVRRWAYLCVKCACKRLEK